MLKTIKNLLLASLLASGAALAAEDTSATQTQLTLDDLRTFTDVFNQIRNNFVDLAIQELIEADRLDPETKPGAHMLSQIYWDIGKYEEARHALESVFEINPFNFEVRAELLRMYQEIGDHEHMESLAEDTRILRQTILIG